MVFSMVYAKWDGAGWVAYRSGVSDTLQVSWLNTGYRLPTEAEWEKTARGSVNYRRFPWAFPGGDNEISAAMANYLSRAPYVGEPYDLGPNGYAAAWATPPMPTQTP